MPAPSLRDLDLGAPAIRADPFPTYAYLREHAPVAPLRRPFLGRVWHITRYADVVEAFRDPRLVCDRRNVGDGKGDDPWWLPRAARIIGQNMLTRDEPDHRRLRGLVHKAFTPRMVDALRGSVERVVEERLERIAAAGRCDLIHDFALPVPLTIISEMMGVEERDRVGFHRLTNRFLALIDGGPLGALRSIPSALRMLRFFRRIVRDHRLRPRADLVSALLDAEEAGDHLTEDEVVGMVFLLLLAGHETTVNLIGNGVLALLDHPAELARLREHPELVEPAIEELLRYGSPVEISSPRFAREDIPLHGETIRRGEMVHMVVAAANRDPAAFERPDRLDITRTPNRHVAFGHGIHFCLGAPLARLEGRIAVQALVRRFPGLALAAPREGLRWRRSTFIRGLAALPLRAG